MKRWIRIWRNYRAIRASEFIDRRAAFKSAVYLASPKPPLPDHSFDHGPNGFDMSHCECGHFMGDHRPDPDGKGTICISCRARMRHRPVDVSVKDWPEVIG